MSKFRFLAAAVVALSASALSVQSAQAVEPGAVHIISPTRSWPVPASIRALIARILKEECETFPIICQVIVPPTTTTTTVAPPTTVTTEPTTGTTVPPTTVITLPVISVPVVSIPVISVPVPVAMPASSTSGSTCTVTMTGGGVAQCTQSASVGSSS